MLGQILNSLVVILRNSIGVLVTSGAISIYRYKSKKNNLELFWNFFSFFYFPPCFFSVFCIYLKLPYGYKAREDRQKDSGQATKQDEKEDGYLRGCRSRGESSK